MTSHEKLHEIYARQMSKRHDFGYPLYEPQSASIIKPGACGYIDQHGRWNPIVDLQNHEELKAKGLTIPIDSLDAAPSDDSISWGPKCSEAVKGRRLDVQAGVSADAMGVPAEAAAVYRFSSDIEFGAILMTESPVLREALYYDKPFLDWVAANSAHLLKIRPEIKNCGLWLVRWTYSTKNCSLNAWTSKNTEVTIGFKAKSIGAGEIGPDAEWYESSTDSGWIHAQAPAGERKVVFLGGLRFSYSKLSISGQKLKPTTKAAKWTFRGDSDNFDEPISIDLDDELYNVNCTRLGQLNLENEDEENDF